MTQERMGRDPIDGLLAFLAEQKQAAQQGNPIGLKPEQYAKPEDKSGARRFQSEPDLIDHWVDYVKRMQKAIPDRDLGP